MPLTDSFTVSSVTPTQVNVATDTRRVTIGEDPGVVGYPTTDFLLYLGSATVTPRRILAGKEYTFQAQPGAASFQRGLQPWYVKAITGSTTFFKEEA